MKRFIKLLIIFGLLFNLNGCKKKEADPIDDNYRVFYHIFVGSFSDSNGDGIGDIRGIINRIDYLNDGDINSGKSLGVQGIWLSPIFDSNSYHKYDTNDYYTIDPQFGTMEDLEELISICHERNIKLILDLVINHTSRQNMWFKNFIEAHQNASTSNKFYNFYTWASADAIPNGRAFMQIPNTNDYYEGNFSPEMPELNFDNDIVRNEVVNIAKYYLDKGIDGFRFDAAKYVYYGETSRSVEFWDWYIDELKKIKPDIYTVGEVWSSDNEVLKYTSELNCFNFSSAQAEGAIALAAKGGDANQFTGYVEKYLQRLHATNPEAMYIPFISNHDMDRSAGYLMMANKYNYMAANLYILCSGSPFIYYGEEIGMKGSRGGSNTDANRRLAMLWGDNDTVKDPEGTTYDASKQTNGTVAEQQKNKDSLYNYYCKVIAMRNKYPQIARGDYAKIPFSGTYVGGFKITYNGEVTYLIHNTSDSEETIELTQIEATKLLDYIGQGNAKLSGTTLVIGPQTSVILK